MPHTQRAFEYMERDVTADLAVLAPESLLYVGWRRGCSSWWDDTFRASLRIPQGRSAVIEIYEDNYRDALRMVPMKVIHGDAREIERHVFPGEFDVIFWDHGPEHVPSSDLELCTKKLITFAGKALVYCCPWGRWPQGPEGGNVYETHYEVDDGMLVNLGMRVRRFGAPGQERNGELVAVVTK